MIRFTKCFLMREGVLASAILLLIGILFISLAIWVLPNVMMLPLIANVIGIFSLLLAPIVLLADFVMSFWPGSKKYFADCNH